MKITTLSQIQSKPIYKTNTNYEKKDDQSRLAEKYEFQKENPNTSPSLWNYTKNEVGKTSHINTVSLGLNSLYTPNWNVIPTKGMKIPSQDELINQIKAVATRTAIAAKSALRNADESTAINIQIEKLLAQYISPVSPDRKTLHQQAMNAIKKHGSENRMLPLGERSLVDYLNKKDNITIETNKPLSGGGIVSATMNSLGGYDYDVTIAGHTLLESVNGKWHYGLTPAESIKKKEFYQIYWSFVDEAKKELKD
ncbi:hypothetical protein FC756_05285 [Lysinibacillus mangiferihumi]|uniref:Uncharacterized protein n=1 Tax=Lysinibacillus mangiferihumi TaxID=1130819 RepID=A0A4U2ZAV7_9BACI|nr:hypothetical protein [Lysinibacillus mangiferihumi]TKI71517.1 hypothetical protein FC756_05285 [Lysinibacillus mangiferihumi]